MKKSPLRWSAKDSGMNDEELRIVLNQFIIDRRESAKVDIAFDYVHRRRHKKKWLAKKRQRVNALYHQVFSLSGLPYA